MENFDWSKTDKYIRKAEDKIKAAELLLEKRFFDDSVSRAYYSMYHATRAVLLIKDLSPKTHKGLISQFGLEFVSKGYLDKLLGKAISFVKEAREKADYEPLITFKQKEAREVLNKAKNFLEKVKEFLDEVKKGEIEVE